PECGFVGGRTGSEYPAFSLPDGVDPAPYLERWPVTPERLKELQEPLLRTWGEHVRLWPGTDFGPISGKAQGKCGDVAWALCSMLFSASAVERLRQAGVPGLTLVPAQITWRSKKAP